MILKQQSHHNKLPTVTSLNNLATARNLLQAP